MTDLSIFFAGTAGSVPTARRGMPAVLVRRGGERLLFDCGEGTQRQLLRSVGLADLDAIFLTHFHTDHWLGLPGLLKTFDLRDRDRPLAIYGPQGLGQVMAAMRGVHGRTTYALRLTELEPGDVVTRDGYVVEAFGVRHRGRAVGYAVIEDDRPGRFDADRARELGVEPGPDFGRLQRGEAIGDVVPADVMGEERPGRRLAITGDTAPCDSVLAAAHLADVLVHEATFADEEAERAAHTGHSTAAQAARLAAEAEVRMLALVHLSTRYFGPEVRDEARAIFPRTEVPRDFDAIEVPLPERGDPVLVPWRQGPREPAPA